MQRQVDEARTRLQESSKLVANNQEVISYLNDELNKWQLGIYSFIYLFILVYSF